MFGFGLSMAISQVPVRLIGGEKTIVFRNLFVSILLAIPLFFIDPNFAVGANNWWLMGLIVVIGYLPLLAYFKAINVGKVGIITPIANSSSLVTVLLSVIFFREILLPVQMLAVALIIGGIILLSVNFRDWRSSTLLKAGEGIPYAVFAMFGWGLVFFLYKFPVTSFGALPAAFLIEAGILICSVLYAKSKNISLSLPPKAALLPIIAVAVLAALASAFLNLGFARANVSIVAPLAFAGPLLAALYGRLFYGEKLTTYQWGAVLVILAGIVILAL